MALSTVSLSLLFHSFFLFEPVAERSRVPALSYACIEINMTAARAFVQKSIIVSVSSSSYCVVQLHSLCVYIWVQKFRERERENLLRTSTISSNFLRNRARNGSSPLEVEF